MNIRESVMKIVKTRGGGDSLGLLCECGVSPEGLAHIVCDLEEEAGVPSGSLEPLMDVCVRKVTADEFARMAETLLGGCG